MAYVFGCEEVEVTYRHMPEDAQFMPVFYQGRKMFRDGATKILRENSTFLPQNSLMPVMWNLDGLWVCKSGNEAKRFCDEDLIQLHTDMESIKKAIK